MDGPFSIDLTSLNEGLLSKFNVLPSLIYLPVELKKFSNKNVVCTSIFQLREYSNSWIFRAISMVSWIGLIKLL